MPFIVSAHKFCHSTYLQYLRFIYEDDLCIFLHFFPLNIWILPGIAKMILIGSEKQRISFPIHILILIRKRVNHQYQSWILGGQHSNIHIFENFVNNILHTCPVSLPYLYILYTKLICLNQSWHTALIIKSKVCDLYAYLKGTVLRDRFWKCWENWQILALIRAADGFQIF
jgi:hypothetical protein